MGMVKRFDVVWVNLDPTIGREIKKTRPAVVISPNEMNKYLDTVIISPLTSRIRNYPTRVDCIVKGKKGQAAIDQIRVIDKQRIVSHYTKLGDSAGEKILHCLQEMFAL
ncbi:MAG: type II toxin-antitoxin system PemK/MazF family toxin [Rickettsiales bacterium]